jgi:cytochrome c
VRLFTSLALISICSLMTACGKPAQESASVDAAPQPAVAAPDDAAMKAQLASLPAPYNTADIDAGKTKFALCRSCHTLEEGGANMTGPNLHGVIGKAAGTHADYAYSDALKASGITWDAASLDKWLTDPKTMVAGSKMSFLGIKDAQDRTNLIAYLLVSSPAK